MSATLTLGQIAEELGCEVEGDAARVITGVAALQEACNGDISFLANPKYGQQAEQTHATAVIVGREFNRPCPAALLRVERPDAAFARIAAHFAVLPPKRTPGVHPAAFIGEGVQLGGDVSIGPMCVVEDGAVIGARTVLVANVYVGAKASIGEDCLVYPQAAIREYVQVGHRCIIHSGAVVGSDGFGYTVDEQGVRTKIPQTGIVVLEDDVELGANVTIDRARFGRTRLGRGVKVDNLVHVAHNVQVGDHAVLVAQVGISGSSIIGERVILAGQSGVGGHVKIGAGAILGGHSGATKDVPPGAHVFGTPARPFAEEMKIRALCNKLPEMRKRIAELEKRLPE